MIFYKKMNPGHIFMQPTDDFTVRGEFNYSFPKFRKSVIRAALRLRGPILACSGCDT